jgi:glutamate racemase
LVSSGPAIARRVEHALAHRGLSNPREDEGDYRFLCTGDVDAFREVGTRFLQMPLGDITHVDLEREPAAAA